VSTRKDLLAHVLLEGERARLRPHAAADAAPAFALLAGQEEILRWLVWNGPRSEADLREHYEHWRIQSDEGNDYRLAIEDARTGALAGSIGVRFLGHPGTGDVGYWIGLPHQDRGIGGEALALLSHLAFRRLRPTRSAPGSSSATLARGRSWRRTASRSSAPSTRAR
jgi:ribosomal-protein-alanine N-acetyltransferase